MSRDPSRATSSATVPAPEAARGAAPARTGSARVAWALRDIVVLAVLAAVFGFLYWALVQAWGGLQVAMGPLGDLAQNALVGGWIVVAPLAVFVVRRPGAGIAAEIGAAFVEFAFLGSPAGPTLLVAGLIQGGGAELAFAATRYRRFGWPTFLASGLTAVTANFLWVATTADWWHQDHLLLRIALQVVSGLLLTGALAKVLADGLLRTGVLDNFPAGRDRWAADAPESAEVAG
ncbi:ECF transporter S component [Actinotalea ferrariae]|uniref:ECF transporter S component n=1 Tax=Actinotalea ferrariae TaxID=1386098 RepID=UPI001C8B6FC0|nr:ECF transporter S component [Actinotalea ferrariae]MBX9247060.1 ECF transporter S component [Actinotalea ferrariae]